MITPKSKELYAKVVMNGIGHLDDEFILEARESEPVSAESTAFHLKKYVISAAAFILIVGALVLFPHLVGSRGNTILPILWNGAEQIDIKVALNPTETAGEYQLTFSNLDGVSEFYFRPDSLPSGCLVTMNGVTLATEDGYYVVDLASFPGGTSSVTVSLSGMTEQEAQKLEISIRLSDSSQAKSYRELEG